MTAKEAPTVEPLDPDDTATQAADRVLAAAVERHGEDNVGPYELAFMYEAMQTMTDRKKAGVWYTPQELVVPTVLVTIEATLKSQNIDPGIHGLLKIVALDPACGCGPFLIEATRHLSLLYAERLCGKPDPAVAVAVTPHLMLECIFGVDIDPVAVELTKRALSIETGGTVTPAMLDRHIVCGNALNNETPPAFEDRIGRKSPAAEGPVVYATKLIGRSE